MIYTIVTGGSKGLGFEISKGLLNAHKNIILIGRNNDALDAAQKQLKKLYPHGEIRIQPMDIANKTAVDVLFQELTHEGIFVEHLFNVAGSHSYGGLETITEENLMTILSANLIGLIYMTSACVKHMKQQSGSRRITSILSTAALQGKKNESIYNATKFGARGFLEAVEDEVKDVGIDILRIYPGGMKTTFWDGTIAPFAIDSFMDPKDVAAQIVNLALDTSLVVSDVTLNRKR